MGDMGHVLEGLALLNDAGVAVDLEEKREACLLEGTEWRLQRGLVQLSPMLQHGIQVDVELVVTGAVALGLRGQQQFQSQR